MTNSLTGWMGTGAVATRCGVSRVTVHEWIKLGKCGVKGTGWMEVPVGGRNGYACLISPAGLAEAKKHQSAYRAQVKARKKGKTAP